MLSSTNNLSLSSKWLKFWFQGEDARAYALLRIGIGLVALINIVDFLPVAIPLLGEKGIVAAGAANSWPDTFSIFFLSQNPTLIYGVIFIAFLASCSLIVGFASQLAAAVLYVWHCSYSHLAIPALGGYDTMLRLLTLILIVSPIGHIWAIDAKWWRRRSGIQKLVPRYGLVLIRWQIFVIYALSFWNKSPDSYWRAGESVGYFLMSNFAWFPSAELAKIPWLNTLLSWGTLMIELAVPFLLYNKRLRPYGFLLGWGLHLGIAITKVYLFSLVIMVCYAAFLDKDDIDNIKASAQRILARLGIRRFALKFD